MTACSKISANILYNCKTLVPGLNDTAYLINFDDIDKDSCTFDTTNPLLMTQIALDTTSPEPTAYYIEGHNYSNEHDTALVRGTYQNGWEHNFRMRVFDNTPDVKDWINDAVGGRFIVIQENNYNDDTSPAGRTVFEVLGYDFGLEVKECTRVAGDEELLGGWNLLLGCHDTFKESKPPFALYIGGSLTATRAAIAALL